MEVGKVVVAERGRKGHSVVVYIAVVSRKERFITVVCRRFYLIVSTRIYVEKGRKKKTYQGLEMQMCLKPHCLLFSSPSLLSLSLPVAVVIHSPLVPPLLLKQVAIVKGILSEKMITNIKMKQEVKHTKGSRCVSSLGYKR